MLLMLDKPASTKAQCIQLLLTMLPPTPPSPSVIQTCCFLSAHTPNRNQLQTALPQAGDIFLTATAGLLFPVRLPVH